MLKVDFIFYLSSRQKSPSKSSKKSSPLKNSSKKSPLTNNKTPRRESMKRKFIEMFNKRLDNDEDYVDEAADDSDEEVVFKTRRKSGKVGGRELLRIHYC